MSEPPEYSLLDAIDRSGDPLLTFQEYFEVEDLGTRVCGDGATYGIMLTTRVPELWYLVEATECIEAWLRDGRFPGLKRVRNEHGGFDYMILQTDYPQRPHESSTRRNKYKLPTTTIS